MPDNLTYYAGWSYDRRDALTFTVSNDGTGRSYSVSLSSGEYLHGLAAGDYADHAQALEDALNAASAAAGGSASHWTVAWEHEGVSGPLLRYVITVASGNFAATLNASAQEILGMAASLSGATSQASTVRPLYVLRCYLDVTSRTGSGDYQPEGVVSEFEADDGDSFGIQRTTRPLYSDWTQMLEPAASVHPEYRQAAAPWQWRDLFDWCGPIEDFVLVDSTNGTIEYTTTHCVGRFRLRAEGAHFRAEPETPDRHTFFNVPIRARVRERFRYK